MSLIGLSGKNFQLAGDTLSRARRMTRQHLLCASVRASRNFGHMLRKCPSVSGTPNWHHGQVAVGYFRGNILCSRAMVGYWPETVCTQSRTVESGIEAMVSSTAPQFAGSWSIRREKAVPFMRAALSSSPSTARLISSVSKHFHLEGTGGFFEHSTAREGTTGKVS